MTWPTYTPDDLAGFSGDDDVKSMPFTPMAITQATLLFKIATCLSDLPDGDDNQNLAKFAILSMADSLLLEQPYRKVKASPFNSENIGSYSYSKVYSRRQAQAITSTIVNGQPTGNEWFDLAVSKLSACSNIDFAGGGIEIFEHDGIFSVRGSGYDRFLGPADLHPNPWSVEDSLPILFDPDREIVVDGEIIFDDPELPSAPASWVEDPNNPGFMIAP